MRLWKHIVTSSIGIALLLPAGAFAAAASCPAGEPTAESSAWDFAGEAAGLLEKAQSGADRIANLADRLRYLPTTTRLSHATRLMNIRREINDLGKTMCRLQAIDQAVLPWQRQAIGRTLPDLKQMAADTEKAILFLNEHPGNLFNPEYRNYASDLYEVSSGMSTMLHDFQEYAHAKGNIERLEHSLELTQTS